VFCRPIFEGLLPIDMGVQCAGFNTGEFFTIELNDEFLLGKGNVGICGSLFLLHKFLCVFVHLDIQLSPSVDLMEWFAVLLT
jgi:hypothetical protein